MTNFDPVDAKGLANLLLDWADERGTPISPMKLQKLAYYCHAEFLLTTGRPLIAQEFEAWEYGPVIPALFHEFKHFKGTFITSRAQRFDPVTAKREVARTPDLGEFSLHIRESFELYIRFSAATLSRMSHVSDGPWSEALIRFNRGKNPGRKIRDHLILAHYRSGSPDSFH